MLNWRAALSVNALLLVGGLAYPFLVYFGLRSFAPTLVALVLLTLVSLRALAVGGRPRYRQVAAATLVAAAGAFLLVAVSPMIGLKAYPILVSLGLGTIFLWSAMRPPTIIERIARLSEPDLPAAAVPYLHKVTVAWIAFFAANAILSAGTAASGDMELWTLYNGFISYLLIGLLFAGELLVRHRVRRRLRSAP